MSERRNDSPAEDYPGVKPEDRDKLITPKQQAALVTRLVGKIKGPLVPVMSPGARFGDPLAMRSESESIYQLGENEEVTCYDYGGELTIEHQLHQPFDFNTQSASVRVTRYGVHPDGNTWFDSGTQQNDLMGMPVGLLGSGEIEIIFGSTPDNADDAELPNVGELPILQGHYETAMQLLALCTDDKLVPPLP